MSLIGRARLVLGVVALLGAAITVGLFQWGRLAESRKFTLIFEAQGTALNTHLLSYLEARLLFLEDLAHHLELSPQLTAGDFRAFVAAERTRVEGIQALEWAPLVPQAQRAKVEADLRRPLSERGPSGALRAASQRGRYFPVVFLEPLEGNRPALGFDLGSNPARIAAIEAARDSGEPRATETLTLVQGARSEAGFLIFVPVYAKGLPRTQLAERRQAFLGVVLGVFRTEGLMQAALGKGLTLGALGELRDPASPWGARPIFAWGAPDAGGRRLSLLDRALLGRTPKLVSTLPFAGRTWEARLVPDAPFVRTHLHKSPLYVCLAALALTALLLQVLHLLYSQKQRAETLVGERSLELRASLDLLKSREEDLRLLLDSTAEAIYGIDMNGCCTFCNSALLKILGFSSTAEVLGRNMHVLIHHTHTDGTPFCEADCRIFKAFRLGKGTYVNDEVVWKADGTPLPVEYWSYPQRRDGQVVGAVVTFIDISARQEALAESQRVEGRWKTALNATGDGVWDWDLKTGAMAFSPRWKEMLGFTDKEFASGPVAWSERIHPEDANPARQCLGDYLAGPSGTAYAFEYRMRCKDDTWKWILCRGMVIQRDAQGCPERMIGTHVDIHARKELEQELLRKDQLLEAMGHALVALQTSEEIDPVLPVFLGTLAQGAGAGRAFLFKAVHGTRSNRETSMSLIQAWCREGAQARQPALQAMPMVTAGLARWLEELAAGRDLEGTLDDFPEQERPFLEALEVGALFLMPVTVRGELWGMLGFDEGSAQRRWSPSEREILRLAAQALGGKLERRNNTADLKAAQAELEERVQHRTRELLSANQEVKGEMTSRLQAENRLAAITSGILQLGPDVRSNLRILVGLLHSLTRAERVAYLSQSGGALHTIAALPEQVDALAGPLLQKIFALPEEEDPLKGAILAMGPGAFLPGEPFTFTLPGTRLTVLAQPVCTEDEVVGFLVALPGAGTHWSAEDRTVLGILCAAASIEERRWRSEEENNLAQMQLHQTQKLESVGRLAAGIAHEINTPLQYLSLNMMFLKKTYAQVFQASLASGALGAASHQADLPWLQEETHKVLTDSMDGIDQVVRIVRAMKEFSHPGSPDPLPVNVNRCLESAATVSRNEWKYVAELSLELDPELSMIQGFPAELNQVFLNLIVNAAQAIGAKGRPGRELGTITIRTAGLPEGVEIRIQDTGTGIAPEHQPKVFDPFFTTKEVGVGTGQGLMVSYQTIVNTHGGKIFFETTPGEGTTFIVQLPLRSPAPRRKQTEGGPA
jgi:PAS domain S-box-containing protein